MANDITLAEVARRSGVSRSAASRALNGKEGVREEVRDRVQLVADSLGYRPHRAAKHLAGGRASVIGLIVGSNDLVGVPYAQALIQAIAHAAERHNEGLMLMLDSNEPGEAVRSLLSDRLFDGVIVSALAAGERWVEGLLNGQMPTVLVGAHPRRDDVVVIDTESQESTVQLVTHLHDQGARRIAYVTGPLSRVDAAARLNGFRLAHERQGLPLDENLVVTGDFQQRRGYALADEILALQPDAVLTANDLMGFGFLDRARELGVEAPRDVLVAGFDGIGADRAAHDLTTMEQPFDDLAERAVASLIGLVDGAEVELEQLVKPMFRWRSTTNRSSSPQEREADMRS